MPHLAPLNWLILPAIFWLSLLVMMSMFWWSQSPKLTFPKLNKKIHSNPWSW